MATPIPAPPITEPTLEALMAKFRCGGYNPQDALNLIGAMFASVLSGGAINVSISNGFILPQYDKIDFTYIDGAAEDDDLIETQVFSFQGDTVATLTYVYVGDTNNIESITLS